MGLSLKKGQKLSLQKDNPSLSKIRLGLGWDVNQFAGNGEFDLDVTAIILNKEGKCENENIVFYNQLNSKCGAVVHTGDNRTGDADGDDESIKVDLNSLPDTVGKIVFIVTIDDAINKDQNFGQVENAYVRIIDEEKGDIEIAKFDLSEDFSIETSVVFCEIYKNNSGQWSFNAVGKGDNKQLGDYFDLYGIDHD
jgi:tellurium resistance protein TerD